MYNGNKEDFQIWVDLLKCRVAKWKEHNHSNIFLYEDNDRVVANERRVIAYDAIISATVKRIQKLEAQNEILLEKNKELIEKNEELERRIDLTWDETSKRVDVLENIIRKEMMSKQIGK